MLTQSNKEGQTPLHSAVLEKGFCKYVDLLMQNNADPKIKDNSNNTALHYNTCVTCLNIIAKALKERESNLKEENKTDHENILDMQNDLGNTCLMQAIVNMSQGHTKTKLARELIKLNADFTIQNNEGNNAIMLAAKLGNVDLLNIIILKILNDELNNQLAGKNKMTSTDLFKLKNNQKDDVLDIAIKSKSKDCIVRLIDLANMKITKDHLQLAKEYSTNESKIYPLIKKYYEEQENDTLVDTSKQSRNHNPLKSKEEVKGKVREYYIKDKLGAKTHRNYNNTISSNLLTFENTKSTSRLKDTLEKVHIDKDKLTEFMDDSDDSNFKLDPSEVQVGEQIGWGAYSGVYKATFYDVEVAVKKFSKNDEKSQKVFNNEVQILKTCHHPGICQLIGYFEDKSYFNIVNEYFPCGTLHEIIHAKSLNFPIKKRLSIAIDIAKVMNYLHSRKLVVLHRDLKSENVLIDKNFKIKLCDFGISKMIESDTEEFELESPLHITRQTKTIGTVSWMSPEFINDKISSKKSDVYSFGILLWEIMTRSKLYPDLQPIQIAYGVANNNLRPPIPAAMNKKIANLITSCW